jgi:predicted nicotinamide N-methyase
VGIAAIKAGAARASCAEIDATACAAITLNAEANGAVLAATSADLIGTDAGWDVVLVGDAFYEKPLADRLLPWLTTLTRRGALVLIGDPGRSYFPRQGLTLLATYEVRVTRELEDSEVKKTRVWRL